MGFKIGKTKAALYPKDIVCDNQVLSEQVKAIITLLVEYQKKLISALHEQKKQLCVSFEDLKFEQTQLSFLHFLYLCSLYGFAEKIYKLIDKKYKQLEKSCEENDENGEEESKYFLQDILEQVQKFPFEDVVKDQVTGLLRLNNLIESVKERIDFPVIKNPSVNWTFRDIIGTIQNHGLLFESLWKHTVSFSMPDNPSIPCPD